MRAKANQSRIAFSQCQSTLLHMKPVPCTIVCIQFFFFFFFLYVYNYGRNDQGLKIDIYHKITLNMLYSYTRMYLTISKNIFLSIEVNNI